MPATQKSLIPSNLKCKLPKKLWFYFKESSFEKEVRLDMEYIVEEV